jgi:hypothetical protein
MLTFIKTIAFVKYIGLIIICAVLFYFFLRKRLRTVRIIFYSFNYLAIVASLIFYSFIIRVMLACGGNHASMFSDPTEMGMNFHYVLAMPYSLVLNLFILLPVSFVLLSYLIIKKELNRSTIILSLLNIVIFYFISLNKLGPITWLAD